VFPSFKTAAALRQRLRPAPAPAKPSAPKHTPKPAGRPKPYYDAKHDNALIDSSRHLALILQADGQVVIHRDGKTVRTL
jgi:hypothetical protein